MMGKKQDKKEAKCMGLKRKAAHLAFFFKKKIKRQTIFFFFVLKKEARHVYYFFFSDHLKVAVKYGPDYM